MHIRGKQEKGGVSVVAVVQEKRRDIMMEIRFIEFFLALNKNSITLSIIDEVVYYAMFYVDDECVNVFLTNILFPCVYFFVYVNDE